MFCPECGVTLNTVEEADVAAGVCPRCHGMWFRQEALRRLVEHEAGELALAFREADRDRERDDYFREPGGSSPAEAPRGVLDALRRRATAEGSAAPSGTV